MDSLELSHANNNLEVDQCIVNVTNSSKYPQLFLFTLFEECYKCVDYQPTNYLSEGSFIYPIYPIKKWKIMGSDPNSTENIPICELSPKLGEFGEYELIINTTSCNIVTITKHCHIYRPLIIIPFLLIVSLLLPIIYKSLTKTKSKIVINNESSTERSSNKSQRVSSIDTFRGIAISMMIFVNSGCGSYYILDHIIWNGLHVADCIFPWFLWIMGFCMPISIHSQLRKRFLRTEILRHIIKRAVILFILGLMVNTTAKGADLATIRIMGVLQRFAVSYLTVGFITLFLTRRVYDPPKSRFAEIFEDLIQLYPQWLSVLAIVILHTCIIFFLPVPNCPSGYLGPGGQHYYGKYENCTGGATRYIDSLILGEKHMYDDGEVQEIFHGHYTNDPENILGCLTTIFQVFLGLQAGMILRTFKSHSQRIYRWLAWAVITGLCGGILCQFEKEEGWIPINKKLWSLSFVLITSSLAFLLFTFCYMIIDMRRFWSGRPFFYAGMNSTLLYVGHSIAYQCFPFHWALNRMNTHFLILLENLWTTVVWIVIAFWLWRKKFFLKI